jgi:hypothetical protein
MLTCSLEAILCNGPTDLLALTAVWTLLGVTLCCQQSDHGHGYYSCALFQVHEQTIIVGPPAFAFRSRVQRVQRGSVQVSFRLTVGLESCERRETIKFNNLFSNRLIAVRRAGREYGFSAVYEFVWKMLTWPLAGLASSTAGTVPRGSHCDRLCEFRYGG